MSNLNPRAKKWVFTVNNYNNEIENQIKQWIVQNCKYGVFGYEEAPTTGTPHLQGFFQCYERLYRRTIKTQLVLEEGSVLSYLEIAKGSLEDNRKYCTKTGKFWEHGELPAYITKECDKVKRTQEIMKDWLELPKDDFDSKWPYESIHWRRKLMEWEASKATSAAAWGGDLKQKNYWIFGAPGTGKSRWVRSQCNGAQCYCKLCNKWWGGYDKRDHFIVLIEDFPLDGKYLGQHMKIWADRYKFTGETKGGQVIIDPGMFFFIVTSNYSIEEVFDGVDCQAIKRRFTEIQIFTQEDIQLMTELPKKILSF